MRTAIFLGLMCIAGSIEDLANKPIITSDILTGFIGVLFAMFLAMDWYEIIKK